MKTHFASSTLRFTIIPKKPLVERIIPKGSESVMVVVRMVTLAPLKDRSAN
jgi:hypothetical protein